MQTKTPIMVALMFSWSISSSAEKILDVYDCKYEEAVSACGQFCESRQGSKKKFRINKEERAVLHVSYLNGKQSSSDTMRKCIIFDEQNWDCSWEHTLSHSGVMLIKTQKMTDGIFVSFAKSIPESKKDTFYSCAK